MMRTTYEAICNLLVPLKRWNPPVRDQLIAEARRWMEQEPDPRGRLVSENLSLRNRRNPMNQLTDKTVSFTTASSTDGRGADRDLMNFLVKALVKLGIRNEDFGYHLLRASMVIIFFFFGYQKWFEYEVERLIPYISNGPLIFWLYPALGMRGATWFLGVSEWTFGTLLFLGFWNRKLGILGALGSSATFIATVTIIPFMPDGWDAAAGGFPAMTGNVPFLMKDVVLLATSLYLLTQDLRRELLSTGTGE
jgi:uncharacterized membrane protein YkgB